MLINDNVEEPPQEPATPCYSDFSPKGFKPLYTRNVFILPLEDQIFGRLELDKGGKTEREGF